MSECVHLFNLLLVRLNVAMSMSSVNEISSELLIAMYRSVSADTEPSIAADPRQAISYIVKSLEKLLDASLDHITVDQLLAKDQQTMANLAEIYLGLLDLIEESQDARDNQASDATNELCLIEDSKSDSGQLFESSMPFSPIPDTTNTTGQAFRTKFPAVLNSSYSGSEVENEHMIEWISGPNQDQRDSSRSEGQSGTVRTNSASLGKQIERRAAINAIKPIKVTSRTEESDLVWSSKDRLTTLSTANTADLLNSVESLQTEQIEQHLENLELSAIEADAISEETLKADDYLIANETKSTDKLIKTLNVIEAEIEKTKDENVSVEKANSNTSDQSIKNLIKAIHQTVDESKAAREKLQVETRKIEQKKKKLKPTEKMQKMLDQESELDQLKRQMIIAEYKTQLDDLQQQDKSKKAGKTIQKEHTKPKMNKAVRPVTAPAPSAGAPIRAPKIAKATATQMKIISKPPLEIGEAELLAAIIDEMPGLDKDHRTLRLLHERQEKHLRLLDKEAREYTAKVRQKDAKVGEIRQRQRLMAKIAEKEEATKKRLDDLNQKKVEEKRLTKEMESKRHKNAKIKKYFADYQQGFKKSLKKKKVQEEKMMKQIFEEGLNIQKTRLRELRTQATEMRQAEADRRENELASIENFYKDKFDMLAESLKGQQGLVRKQEKENRRERLTAKNELTKRLEQELQDMQDCILRENESMFYRDMEQQRLLKEIRMAKFKTKLTKEL